jgi:hypothetical protein
LSLQVVGILQGLVSGTPNRTHHYSERNLTPL